MADEVKLIDADKLIGYLHERYFWDDDDRDMVFKAIEEQPTIETEPVNDWISVKDRLPEDDVSILICSTRKTISKATYSSDMGRYYIADSDLWYNELDITHWQPLPKPPKEG